MVVRYSPHWPVGQGAAANCVVELPKTGNSSYLTNWSFCRMRFHRNGVCCFCRSRPVTSYSGWTKSMSTDSVLKKVRRPTCFSPSLSLSLSFSRARDIMHIRPSALVLSSLPFPPPFHGSSSFAPVWNVQSFCPRYNVSNGRRICILTFCDRDLAIDED